MPVALLTLGKLALLLALYVFLWRVVRVVAADLRDPAPAGPRHAPRPTVAEPERRQPGRRAPTSLVVHPPNGAPWSVELGEHQIVFGRAERCDQQLADDYVSDEHAALLPVDGEWRVRDLGSTNGTMLNGQQVIAPTVVTAGDQLQLGRTRVEVRR